LTDFRGPLPLRDSDFADVRRRVLSKIERRTNAPLMLGFAVAAAVVALIIVLLPHPKTTTTTTNPLPVAVHRKAPVVVAPPAPVAKTAEAAPAKPKPRKPPQVASVGGPPADSEIYMDIQTSDPNVRIIWIERR
jgi:hypothetical protein